MGLWRNIFGPGQDEVWGGLAKQVGADYSPGGWAKTGRIDLHQDGHIIALDTYTVSTGKSSATYTRMRSPFRNTRDMQMNIYRASIFTGLGKLLGMSDIAVGDTLFDEHFVVQGKSESAIKTFLRDPKIRQLIEAQPNVLFKIKPDDGWFFKQYPEGIDELYFVCRGLVKDAARLKQLFELFVASIDKLSEIDCGCVFDVKQASKS